MSPFSVRCFKKGNPVPVYAFFILSKGRNTGRPSFTSCPNCFVFACENKIELQSYYWLGYSLWAAGKFHPYLCGSVIEFIHLRDLKNLIASAAQQVRDMEKVARSMQQIIELEAHLNRQFLLVKEAKQAVLHSLMG